MIKILLKKTAVTLKECSINDLKFMRPYNGIGVKDLKKVLNKKVKKSIKKNKLLKWNDLI